jgi:hypothetical protein
VNSLAKTGLLLALLLPLFWLIRTSSTEPQGIFVSERTKDKSGNSNKGDRPLKTPSQHADIPPSSSYDRIGSSFKRPCTQRLQFIVSSEQSIKQAADFQQQFLQDSRLTMLPICIAQPLWIEPGQLHCEGNWLGKGRLGCDLQGLGTRLKTLNFTHVVIFANQGKANVHNGIMYLDRQDTYDVFVHELAHFAGFIDEYPLSKALATAVCEGRAAPNLVFQQARQSQADVSLWSSISDEFGVTVTRARTCDNHAAQAFKPSADITFMEFYDLAYIPPVYIAAWLKRLANPQALTPAYINFAQLYEGRNKLIQGKFWRQRYVDYMRGE